MPTLTFHAQDERDTTRLGAALAEALPSGAVVSLLGTLGAGKTRLVQAVASASGVAPKTVVSPTFVLIQEYAGRRPIYHFDAYRLRDEDEFLELGPEEYFDGQGLSFVEWADRVERAMPADRLEVHIHVLGEHERQFEIDSPDGTHTDALERLASLLGL